MSTSPQRIAEALRVTAARIDDDLADGRTPRLGLDDVAGICRTLADQFAPERPDLRDRSTTGSSASAKEAAAYRRSDGTYETAEARQQAAEARQRVAFGTSPHGSADDVPDPLRHGAFIVCGRRFEYDRTPRGYFGWFVDSPSRGFIAKTFSDLQDAVKIADKQSNGPASFRGHRNAEAAQQADEVDTSSPASEPVVVQLGRHAFESLGGPFYASAAPPTGAGSHYLSDYRFLDDGRLYSFRWDTTGPTRSHLRRVNDPGSLAAVPVAAWRHATPVGSHLCFSFDVFHHFDTPDRPSFVIGRDRYAAIVATLEKFAAHITKGPR